MRKYLFVVLIFVSIALGFHYQAILYPRSVAEWIAEKTLRSSLSRGGLNPDLLKAPQVVQIGNAPWAFEWKFGDKMHYGVWIANDGTTEIYSYSDTD